MCFGFPHPFSSSFFIPSTLITFLISLHTPSNFNKNLKFIFPSSSPSIHQKLKFPCFPALFCQIQQGVIMSTEKEKKIYIKGGKVSWIEPQKITEIMQSPYIIMLFEEASCLPFCQKIQEVRFNVKLTSVFATMFKENEIIIIGVNFMISPQAISSATEIPLQGGIWLKRVDLDLEC